MESPKKTIYPIEGEKIPVFPNQGKIPSYLKKRAITLEEEAKAKIIIKEQKSYPPGTRLLSDPERLETLNNLHKQKSWLQAAIMALPITMDTYRANAKKRELDAKMDEIEKAITVYSRSRVFVAV